MNRPPRRRIAAAWRLAAMGSMLLASAAIPPAIAADTPPWPVAGRMGIVRVVIVPTALAADRAAYDREIDTLCAEGQTCFLNFYSNSAGAEASLPLPDAIQREATALFRRSSKQSAEYFQWSCRMKIAPAPDSCF